MKNLGVSIILIFFVILNISAQKNESSFNESYEITSPFFLKTQTFEGSIEISAQEKNTIEVFYSVIKNNKLLTITKNEFEQHFNLKIVTEKNKFELHVEPKFDEKKKYWKEDVQVSILIKVPKETSVELVTSKGNLSIKGLSANQKCNTDDGNIEAEKITGTSIFETNNGNIIFKDLSGTVISTTPNGKIQGNMKAIKDSLILSSETGNINVIVPGGLGLDLLLKGKIVNTNLSKFTGTSQRTFVKGKLNNGGIPVKAVSNIGNVSLFFN